MKNCDHTAKKIAEDVLEGTGVAISTGDFTAFVLYFELPQLLETVDGSREIVTTRDLKDIFDRFQHYLRIKQISTLERHCISAAFITTDLIHTTHESRLVTGVTLAETPYPVFSKLKRSTKGWKIIFSQTAFPGSTSLNGLVKSNSQCQSPPPKK